MSGSTGSTWSVDIAGTQEFLARVDGGAEGFTTAATQISDSTESLAGALHGSATVRGALSGFFGDRETVPSRVLARVRASTGAVIESVDAVTFADEEMATAATSTAAPLVDDAGQYSADRFAGRQEQR
jgi:hypothetical protein